MESHPTDAFKHAKDRTEERFGIRLTSRKHKQLLYQIKSGKALFAENAEGGRTRWIVKIGDRRAKVIFDKQLDLIVTVTYLSLRDWQLLERVGKVFK